jgi:hypothetical protein
MGERDQPPVGRPPFKFLHADMTRPVVLGIFDEFDELPPDGRSGPRIWKRALPESEK